MAQLNGIGLPPCKNPIECYKKCKNGAFPCIDPKTVKIYRPIPGQRTHALVKAAAAKGLTNVTITRGLGKGAARTGWTLHSDQVPRLHLGYEIDESLNRISQISI